MSDSRVIQRGTAKVYTVAGALDAYALVALQTLKAKHNWDAQNIKDFAGFEFAWDARNTHIITNINFKLTSTSLALAKANGVFLAEFAEVTLSGFDLDWLNATGVGGFYTGYWCYCEGGSLDLSNEQPGGMEIALRKFKDPTQNALQFSTPS